VKLDYKVEANVIVSLDKNLDFKRLHLSKADGMVVNVCINNL